MVYPKKLDRKNEDGRKVVRGIIWGIELVLIARLSYCLHQPVLLSNTAHPVDLLPGGSSVESSVNGACPPDRVLDE